MQLANIDSNLIVERTSSNGRRLGYRVHYAQSMSATEIKQMLRESGVKQGLNAKCSEILRGEADIRWMTHQALESAMRSKGFVPDRTDLTSKTASTKWILPSEEKPKKEKALKPSDEGKQLALAALLATGLDKATAEEALRKAGVL